MSFTVFLLALLCPLAATAIECQNGSFTFGSSCYWFDRQRTMNYPEAEKYCRDTFDALLWIPECQDEWVSLFIEKMI